MILEVFSHSVSTILDGFYLSHPNQPPAWFLLTWTGLPGGTTVHRWAQVRESGDIGLEPRHPPNARGLWKFGWKLLVWFGLQRAFKSISIPINSKMILLNLFLFVMLVAFCRFFFRIAPFMDNLIFFTLRTSTLCMGLVFVLCTGTQGLASRIRLR